MVLPTLNLPAPLTPLPRAELHTLSLYLVGEDLCALTHEAKRELPDLVLWLATPLITAYTMAYDALNARQRAVQAQRLRDEAVEGLRALLEEATDPTERRRLLTQLLTALRPDTPKANRAPRASGGHAENALPGDVTAPAPSTPAPRTSPAGGGAERVVGSAAERALSSTAASSELHAQGNERSEPPLQNLPQAGSTERVVGSEAKGGFPSSFPLSEPHPQAIEQSEPMDHLSQWLDTLSSPAALLASAAGRPHHPQARDPTPTPALT